MARFNATSSILRDYETMRSQLSINVFIPVLVLSLEKRGENRYPGTMINTSRVLRGCYEGIFVRLGGKKKNVATWSTACIHPHPPPRALHNCRGRRAWSNVYGKLVLPRNIGCTLEECRVTMPKSCPLERLILLFLIVSHRLNRELNDWNDFFNETHWYPCTSSLTRDRFDFPRGKGIQNWTNRGWNAKGASPP